MSLVYFLHSPASDSGSFLLYPQVRKPWSHLPSARLGESLQVFHLLADPFSPASQLLPIHRVCNNECDLGEEERSLGETTGLGSGDRAGLITTWGKGAMGVVKKFLFKTTYSLKVIPWGPKGPRTTQFYQFVEYRIPWSRSKSTGISSKETDYWEF